MTRYLLPLEVVALLLTAAMIGAVIIALQEKKKTGSTGVRHQFNATSAPRPGQIAQRS